jgi:hypothetical protein
VFNKKVVTPIFVALGVFIIFTSIVFPGLTVNDGIINIISTLIAIFTLALLFYYIDSLKITKLTDEQIKEKLESELGPVIDEMAKTVLEKSKKKKTKSEFPMEPHHKPKKDKVMGEYQLNNKEKVRKSLIKERKK